MNHEAKTVKKVKMLKCWVCAYTSQDFVQGQENVARLHDRVTVTFRNSAKNTMLTDTKKNPIKLMSTISAYL